MYSWWEIRFHSDNDKLGSTEHQFFKINLWIFSQQYSNVKELFIIMFILVIPCIKMILESMIISSN